MSAPVSAAIRRQPLSKDELHQLKWLLGGLLTLVGLWTLSFLEAAQSPILYLAGFAVLLVLLFPQLPGKIPRWLWSVAGPVLIAFVLLDIFVNLNHLIPALIRTVVLLALYRSLQYRTSREDLQLLLINLFMVVVSGVLTVSLVFALQISLFSPLAMALLLIVCLLDSSRSRILTVEQWSGFRLLQFLIRVVRVLDARTLGFASGLFILLSGISALIFISMPRFQLDQAVPFLRLPSQAKSGFSETIEFGAVTEITQDDSIALRIDVPGNDAATVPGLPYWRMLVLDHYQDGRFMMSDSLKQVADAHFGAAFSPTGQGRFPDTPHREDASWQFYLEGGTSAYLPVLGPFGEMRFEGSRPKLLLNEVLVYRASEVTATPLYYRVEHMVAADRLLAAPRERRVFEAIALGASIPPQAYDRRTGAPKYPLSQLHVGVPANDLEYLNSVVREVLPEADEGVERPAAEAFSQRLIDWLHAGRGYSLSSDSSGPGDAVCNWLRSSSDGHCELFAGAFTLIARQAGYPTRVVVGFAGGSWNTVQNYFVVRNSNAHAWVEIYDRESQEWLRIDPTPGNSGTELMGGAFAGTRFGMEIGWTAWLDSLRILWYRQVVNFDESAQEEILAAGRSWLKAFSESFKERWEGLRAWVSQPLDFQRGRDLLLLLLSLVLLYLLFRFRHKWIAWLGGRGGRAWLRRRQQDPLRKRASRLLKNYTPLYQDVVDDAERTQAEQEAWKDPYRGLQEVRFGPGLEASQAEAIFLKARQQMCRYRPRRT